MDLYIFSIALFIVGKPIKWVRVIIASMVAALIYCIALVWPVLAQLPMGTFYLFVPIVSILYLFKPKRLKDFIKAYGVCLMIAWGIGGIGFYLYFQGMQYGIKQRALLLPVISGALLWLILYLSIRWLRTRRIQLLFQYDVSLVHRDKKINLKGFLDSGNHLYTLDGQPVHVIPKQQAHQLLPNDYVAVIDQWLNGQSIEELIQSTTKGMKMHLIPFESVGCKEGVLIGFCIEQMIVKRNDVWIEKKNCIIGIAPRPLTSTQTYDALLHPELITIK